MWGMSLSNKYLHRWKLTESADCAINTCKCVETDVHICTACQNPDIVKVREEWAEAIHATINDHMGHERFQVDPTKFQSLWQTCGGEMASWSPGNAPAKFASHFATEEDRLIAKVAEGGSWALWIGVFNKAWLQLLKSYGMNHNACMKLTRDICRTITKYRIGLHNVRFKPEKARRAAEKVKNREALGDYIRKWYNMQSSTYHAIEHFTPPPVSI
jgi:hypothetical protein